MKRSITVALMSGILLFLSLYIGRAGEQYAVYTMAMQAERAVVVLDAGHGGKDPGKVSVNGALEKDINLAIAKKLERLLMQNEIMVIMTRTEDCDLASEHADNRKNEDLKARVQLINDSIPALVVSIHQNSYPEEDVDGAQVFYYAASESGKQLGQILQEHLKAELADGNHRVAKANKDYYLLKKSTVPTVIVECGFLSNEREAALLASEEYQEKIAFSLLLGIMEYINTTKTEE